MLMGWEHAMPLLEGDLGDDSGAHSWRIMVRSMYYSSDFGLSGKYTEQSCVRLGLPSARRQHNSKGARRSGIVLLGSSLLCLLLSLRTRQVDRSF